MSSGLVVWLEFSDAASESRFLSWVARGNAKSASLGVGALGLRGDLVHVSGRRYLFFWNHFFMFSLSWFLRLCLWFVTRRIRKGLKITRVKKLDLVELLMSRGFGR